MKDDMLTEEKLCNSPMALSTLFIWIKAIIQYHEIKIKINKLELLNSNMQNREDYWTPASSLFNDCNFLNKLKNYNQNGITK